MIRDLRIDPSDAVPIWRQIEQGVQRLVASGGLEPGESMPSVRDLARQLRVNPATVAKAYRRLTDAGLLTVQRGEGTFVSEDPPTMRRADRRSTLAAGAARFAILSMTVGATREEAIRELRLAFKRVAKVSAKGA
jgi:GntR family transcriptional regulator